jgi:hypothetical protein
MKLLQGAEQYLTGAPREASAVQEPAVFRERRKELLAEGGKVNTVEVVAQCLQEWLSVRNVADLCRHHEGHCATRSKQARGCNQERGPR